MRPSLRQAAAAAVVTLLAPLASGCDFKKTSSPLGPFSVAVHGSPGGSVSGNTPASAPNRPADPPDGHRLGLPDMAGIVARVADANPGAMAASCGTWEFMDLLVDELRRHDTRWGYNWKRGNVGDASHDVIAYHRGAGPDEGSTDVYLIDVIAGHCGDRPFGGWLDVTDATHHAGTIGRWTGRERF